MHFVIQSFALPLALLLATPSAIAAAPVRVDEAPVTEVSELIEAVPTKGTVETPTKTTSKEKLSNKLFGRRRAKHLRVWESIADLDTRVPAPTIRDANDTLELFNIYSGQVLILQGNHTAEFVVDGGILIADPGSKINSSAITVKNGGIVLFDHSSLDLNGGNLQISGDSTVLVQGSSVDVNGGNLSLEDSAGFLLVDSPVKINGGDVAVSGEALFSSEGSEFSISGNGDVYLSGGAMMLSSDPEWKLTAGSLVLTEDSAALVEYTTVKKGDLLVQDNATLIVDLSSDDFSNIDDIDGVIFDSGDILDIEGSSLEKGDIEVSGSAILYGFDFKYKAEGSSEITKFKSAK